MQFYIKVIRLNESVIKAKTNFFRLL